MVRVRITKDPADRPDPDDRPTTKRPSAKRRSERPTERHEPPRRPPEGRRGLSERQWFIGLLVVSGLLLLFTFRGCVLPSGIGPKSPPAAEVTPAATPTTAPVAGNEYTVESGDTLSGIAQKTGTTLEALAEANNIDLNQRIILRVGQTLQVPQ